jgi:uncharacterized protein YjbI with pentapeptide repeats
LFMDKHKRLKNTTVSKTFFWGIVLGLLIAHFRQARLASNRDEITLLQRAGNSGFSPATAYVMQLYRDGKLSGDTSVLRNKNLFGANWQNIVLPKANLEGIILQHANLQDAYLVETNLSKANLKNANLNNADLRGAKLQSANFMQASLRKASLIGVDAKRASFFMTKMVRAKMLYAKLERVHLSEADLHAADLHGANLTNAHLWHTNLADANLKKANLSGAQLQDANLTGADLSGTRFSAATILPDAKWLRFDSERNPIYDKYWTAETDMRRYTNPEHPDFWQPDWVKKYDWVQKNYEEV